jgi:hypothetical protein
MVQNLVDCIVNIINNYNVSENKKQFAESLHQIIDYRFAALMKDYKSAQINDLINLIESLNTAPEPPKPNEDLSEWSEKYAEWYLNQRHKVYSLISTLKENFIIIDDEK